MRLLLACSANGVLAHGPKDDMSWTGPIDKAIFRTLTGVGGMCAAGTATYDLMPALDGREFIPLSRNGFTLRHLQNAYPDAWLLGGPNVAKAALLYGLVTEFHLCRIEDVVLKETDEAYTLKGMWGHMRPASMETHMGNVTLELRRFN